MEQWQFLIQKQGDRSWHNLESPNLEISEGRYRVLARSHLRNTDVEIRVTHSSTQEIPPKRRIQKRSRRTNAEGLMAVIPFTHLKPGIWELQCSGDLLSDLLGQSWQYGINLQVLSQESPRVWEQSPTGENATSNLSPSSDITSDSNLKSPIAPESQPTVKNDPVLTDLPTQTPTDGTVIEQPVSPVWLEGETAEQLLQNLMALALPVSETLLKDGKVEETSDPKPPLPLSLTLDQDTHIAHWGEITVIHGRVERQDQTNQENDTPPDSETFYALELIIEMRSPLGSEILTQVRQPLPNSSLPMTISSAINIPVDCKSKLILADINLYGAFTEFGEVVILANKTFTITADVTQLLAITAATKLHEQNLLDHPITPPTEPEPSISIDLGLFNLAKTAKAGDPQFIQTSLNKSLPPQFNLKELEITSLRDATPTLRVSELNNLADSRLPQLPRLPENQITAKAALIEGVVSADVDTESSSDEALVEKNETIAPINLAQLVISHHRVRMLNSTFPYLKRLKALPEKTEESKNDTPDELSLETAEDSPQMDTTVCEQEENTPELVISDAEFQDESVPEISLSPNLELSAEINLNSSPLIRKWTQSQGYSLPQSIIEVLDQQKIPDEQAPLSTQTEEINSSHLESATDIGADQIPLLPNATETESAAIAVEIEEMKTLESVEAEDISVEISASPDSQLPPADHLATPQPWLTQEFVVEDTTEPAVDLINSHYPEQNEQLTSDLSHTPLMEGKIVESLPIPQLHIADGELIAGTSVRVRVELPTVSPQIVVKLWMEDCQSRGLVDGPHLLTDLLPNHLGGLEVITQLNIPFGCLEISLEAIAFDQATQQESHKVTVVRTVIPPDLPNLQLDELLGI
ncbi:MAG: hypothetical protein EA343_01445 [Nodularia sp. (in: Bacteria)]|nr:MAG: hypothetical protein EA343_01445 [Nodularia sp. (in: cyanobacteria)]